MLSTIKGLLSGQKVSSVRHIESDITIVLGDVRLWVDSPWRLEREGAVVVGSGNLVETLSHEDYKADYDDWITVVERHASGSISDVEFSELNEITFRLSSGHTLRTFQDYGDDAENFQLYVPGKRYLVYPHGVEVEESSQ